jgi:hypothetical protein
MKNVGRWIVCLALAAGCVEQPAQNRGGVSSQELEAVRRRVARRQAPTPQHPLNITFGNKVQLIGYDINVTELRPGQSVTVTWHWKCNASLGEGWRLFTHLDDAARPRTNQDGVGEVRRAYQPERWRAGEYIADTQTFDLPAEWDSPVVRVHVGFWKDAERLQPSPAEATDGDRRARALELRTGVQIQVSEMAVGRTSGAINADGRLDEPAWNNAARTGALVNTATGDPATGTDARATARMLWDDTNLYIAFEVSDENLVDPSANRDDHLWEHDAVEVMIDPDGDGQNYYEFQVSPRNQRFDTRYDRPRQPSTPTPGHIDFNPETRTGAVVTGTIGNDGDNDTGYVVEMAIPWASINTGLAHTPPQVGDTVRVNLFVMDEAKQGGHRFAAWSAPRTSDFHVLERFGRISLATEIPSPAQLPAGIVVPAVVGEVPSAQAAPTPAPSNRRAIPNTLDPAAIQNAVRQMRQGAARRP